MATTIAELVQMKVNYENTVKAEGKRLLAESFKEFFVKHPEVKAIQWSQYTPYFNDGEECRFSVHGDYPKLRIKDGELDEEPYPKDDTSPLFDAAAELIGDAPEDVMRFVFGDHAEITATVDGFDVERADHD